MSSLTYGRRAGFWPTVAVIFCAGAASSLTAGRLPAQTVSLRVSGIDMYGGIVLPQDSDLGVAFGARVGLADLFDGAARAGFELDWWTAKRSGADLKTRDIIAGFAVWKEFGGANLLRPFFGLGTALHAVDVSRADGTRLLAGESAEADRLDGYRMGADVFAGLTLKLTPTGALWLVVEYRYAALSSISHHEIRAGARLLATE